MARARRERQAAATSTAPEGVLAQLGGLGLARNEALAYLTLLEDEGESGITGYEVASRSGIPRSAVYAVLRKLEAMGAAFAVGTDPVCFVATDPGRWVARCDSRRSHASKRWRPFLTHCPNATGRSPSGSFDATRRSLRAQSG